MGSRKEQDHVGFDPVLQVFQVRILRKSSFKIFKDGLNIMQHAKHIFKERLLFETNQHQLYDRWRNNTIHAMMLNGGAMQYDEIKAFDKAYISDLHNTLDENEAIISQLSAADGPYEMVKKWLNCPSVKDTPELLKLVYNEITHSHHKVAIEAADLVTKRMEIFVDLKDCRATILRLDQQFDESKPPTASQIKEQRMLSKKLRSLQRQKDKNLRKYKILAQEEAELREHFIKQIDWIKKEIQTFETERFNIANAAFEKFAFIMKQRQQSSRTGQDLPSTELMKAVSSFPDCPFITSDDWDEKYLKSYSTPYFYNVLCDGTDKSDQSTGSPSGSEQSTEADAAPGENSSSPPVLSSTSSNSSISSDLEAYHHWKKRAFPVKKSSDAEDQDNTPDKRRRAPKPVASLNRNYFKAQAGEPSEESIHRTKSWIRAVTHYEASESETLSDDLQSDDSEVSLNPPTSHPAVNSENQDETPNNGATPRNLSRRYSLDKSENQEETPANGGTQNEPGYSLESSEDVDYDEDDEDDDDDGEDLVLPSRCDLRSRLPSTQAWISYQSHTESDINQLSYKKGQKVIQTHEANGDNIAYGYTRRNRLSRVKYGHFNLVHMERWKPISILKHMF